MTTEEKTPDIAPVTEQPIDSIEAAQLTVTAVAAEITGAVTAEAPAEVQQPSLHDARFQEELEAHDRNILAALDEMLARQQQPAPQKKRPQDDSGIEKFAIGIVRKGAGIVSLSLILVFMGIVVVCCFFSPSPDYLLPLKLSPIAAVLIGIELLIYHVISGRKFRIHIPAMIISALIIAGCCTMAVVLNNSYTESQSEYDNRSIAAKIYESGYYELRHAADIAEIEVDVDLNPDGMARKSGIESLSTDDIVKLKVTFNGSYGAPAEFASECKTVIDAYRFLGIPVTEFDFISETKFNSYRLNVKGMFMQDYSEAQLLENVHHVYVEGYDYIDDLEDFVAESVEATETQEI